MFRVDLISKPGREKEARYIVNLGPVPHRYFGGRVIVLTTYFDHCGNCPGYCVSWVAPQGYEDHIRLVFDPMIVCVEEPTDQVQPYLCDEDSAAKVVYFLREAEGQALRPFKERNQTTVRLAAEPQQALWRISCVKRNKKTLGFAIRVAASEWKPGHWTVEYDNRMWEESAPDAPEWIKQLWEQGRILLNSR